MQQEGKKSTSGARNVPHEQTKVGVSMFLCNDGAMRNVLAECLSPLPHEKKTQIRK